jgi:hypothetical protein
MGTSRLIPSLSFQKETISNLGKQLVKHYQLTLATKNVRPVSNFLEPVRLQAQSKCRESSFTFERQSLLQNTFLCRFQSCHWQNSEQYAMPSHLEQDQGSNCFLIFVSYAFLQ